MSIKQDVTDYIVILSIPCKENAWRADLVERELTECTFNYVIIHSMSVEERKSGARIVKVFKRTQSEFDENASYWDRII